MWKFTKLNIPYMHPHQIHGCIVSYTYLHHRYIFSNTHGHHEDIVSYSHPLHIHTCKVLYTQQIHGCIIFIFTLLILSVKRTNLSNTAVLTSWYAMVDPQTFHKPLTAFQGRQFLIRTETWTHWCSVKDSFLLNKTNNLTIKNHNTMIERMVRTRWHLFRATTQAQNFC